jgi:hypothetical protein
MSSNFIHSNSANIQPTNYSIHPNSQYNNMNYANFQQIDQKSINYQNQIHSSSSTDFLNQNNQYQQDILRSNSIPQNNQNYNSNNINYVQSSNNYVSNIVNHQNSGNITTGINNLNINSGNYTQGNTIPIQSSQQNSSHYIQGQYTGSAQNNYGGNSLNNLPTNFQIPINNNSSTESKMKKLILSDYNLLKTLGKGIFQILEFYINIDRCIWKSQIGSE